MKSKIRLRLTFIVVVGLFIVTAIRAFSTPWRWTTEQCCVAFVIACLPVGIAKWGGAWKCEGWAGIRKQWLAIEEASSSRDYSGRRGIQVAIWIVIALALVAYFNWKQGTGLK